jgi:GNAT superfamily N-acetyltransferase
VADLVATELDDVGLARAAELLRDVFPAAAHLDPAYLRWSYAGNPMGEAIALDARAGEAVVAHLAGRALIARWGGREVRGYLIHHAATRASHRGQELFSRLLAGVGEQARARGAEFLIAVANASSAPIFVSRHGFQDLGPLDVELGVGLPPRFGAPVELAFEPLWNSAALTWRLARPGSTYRARRVGDAIQFAAASGLLGAWVELGWARAEALETVPPTFEELPRLGARIGLDPRRRQRPWPALPIPRGLRPSPLELVFRDLLGSRGLRSSHLSFSALDFDAY